MKRPIIRRAVNRDALAPSTALALPDRKHSSRWAKGVSGNPAGKPKGRHRAHLAMDAIGQDGAEEIIRKVVAEAIDGDMRAAEIILARIWPVRKGRPVKLHLPAISTAADIASAMAAVVAAMATGEITPEEAGSVSTILDMQARTLELVELEKRIQNLEKANGSPS